MPHCNDAGVNLIAQFEGDSLRAYPDPASALARTGAGDGSPWTIGFGHTCNVHAGETITQAQAIAFLRDDITNAEQVVSHIVEISLTPNQFAALTSFQYNTGGLPGSAVLQCVNERDHAGAMTYLLRWVYAGGEQLAGLVRRREAEKHLYETT